MTLVQLRARETHDGWFAYGVEATRAAQSGQLAGMHATTAGSPIELNKLRAGVIAIARNWSYKIDGLHPVGIASCMLCL